MAHLLYQSTAVKILVDTAPRIANNKQKQFSQLQINQNNEAIVEKPGNQTTNQTELQ